MKFETGKQKIFKLNNGNKEESQQGNISHFKFPPFKNLSHLSFLM